MSIVLLGLGTARVVLMGFAVEYVEPKVMRNRGAVIGPQITGSARVSASLNRGARIGSTRNRGYR